MKPVAPVTKTFIRYLSTFSQNSSKKNTIRVGIHKNYGIHWFRRDLRVAGNPALSASLERHEGRVLGLFLIDSALLSRPDISPARFAFLLQTLQALKNEMREQGGELRVLDLGPAEKGFRTLLKALKSSKSGLPSSVSFNRDYEPFAKSRDLQVATLLEEDFEIEACSDRDHLLLEPNEIEKDKPGSWYKVYSPFQKKWLKAFAEDDIQARLTRTSPRSRSAARFRLTWKALPTQFQDSLDDCLKRVQPQVDIPLPPAGHAAALQEVRSFARDRLRGYAKNRDFPAIHGTSHLSIYLKNGSITVPQIIAELKLDQLTHGKSDHSAATRDSRVKFLNELIWREFYYHILHHVPRVEQEAFQVKYKDLKWENDSKLFKAWCEGRTGFPIVDAAMRQLNTTGWMHNRMRMVVASFLTKDLLIDWRWGERYFMLKLLDGDLAANNGGWQWAASTGCDPQPYFRVFNPTLQGKRFDPDGEYVKKFVPELSKVERRFIHEPWKSDFCPKSYPSPIVDHSKQSKKAIAFFKSHK